MIDELYDLSRRGVIHHVPLQMSFAYRRGVIHHVPLQMRLQTVGA